MISQYGYYSMLTQFVVFVVDSRFTNKLKL